MPPFTRALLFATTVLTGLPAMAAPTLLAIGTLSGSTDLAPSTGTLENGLDGNILGGMGSALAWAGGYTFLAAPDRGPNATAYNTAVDNTASYIARFQTVTMALTPSGGGALPFNLTPTLAATTLLSSPTALNYGTGVGLGNKIDGTTPIGSGAPALNTSNQFFFTGRSDNFGAGNSGNANNARLDPEGMRVSVDGKSVFISDEYGPYVYQFDRATGQRIRSYALPSNLYVPNLSPVGNTEITGNTTGRTANKGLEGLAITPDGKTLIGMMQAPLIQDAAIAASNKLLRIVTIDVASGATKEYGYLLTTGSGVSEITAINDHEFLVDERDGNGLGAGNSATNKKVYKIDLTGAADITNLSGAAAVAAAVAKNATPLVDLVALLGANGITRANVPAKIEGLAFGEDLLINGVLTHTLWIANDNDFVAAGGPATFYVVGVTNADLAGSVFNQQIVPEPMSLAIFSAGLAGIAIRRRARKV